MGFGGRDHAFDSPAAAVAGMIAQLAEERTERGGFSGGPGVEACPPEFARGRILAEAIAADRDNPAFDYAAMDGYAVRAADVARACAACAGRSGPAGLVTLRVVGESRIGSEPPRVLEAGGVVRIATGAAVPGGADAVIKRERVTEHGFTISVTPDEAMRVRTGDHIRRRAENASAGAVVLAAGTVLSAAALGTLAAVGVSRPRVACRLRVAVITTGDELVAPEAAPGPFQIRDSNGAALGAVLGAHAWIGAARAVHVRDDGADLAGALRSALASADAVVLSGGVSVGHRDPVRSAVEGAGARIVFHGLPQRPGKPMLGAVGTGAGGRRVPIFGLPGNPVSAMVTCVRIVVPVLAGCTGAARRAGAPRVAVANPDGKSLDLWWHRLVRITAGGAAELVEAAGSGDLVAGGASDGFIEVPPGEARAGRPNATALYSFYSWSV